MKTYQVSYTQSKPDWDNIPILTIDQHLWSNVRTIIPQAQLAWDEKNLYIRLQTIEPNIRREYTGNTDPVCLDSCLEFFFCPEASGDRYFNIEANPNGSLYVGFGLPGEDRCRLSDQNWKNLLHLMPFEFIGGWGIEMQIPVKFIRIFIPSFRLYSGLCLRANFYKCGNLTEQEHYIAWNPIEGSLHSFHIPQCFGEIQFLQ